MARAISHPSVSGGPFMSGTNGHNAAPIVPPVPDPIVVVEAKPKRKKKHVPIAPPGGVPSGEVVWVVKHGEKTEWVTSQTWFGDREKAMARVGGASPHGVEGRRKGNPPPGRDSTPS